MTFVSLHMHNANIHWVPNPLPITPFHPLSFPPPLSLPLSLSLSHHDPSSLCTFTMYSFALRMNCLMSSGR